MPVSPHQVPLDTAKTWAKRLHRALQDGAAPSSLSSCQTVLAQMLGHADWHALHEATKSAPMPAGIPPKEAPQPDFQGPDMWSDYLTHINAQYPGLNAIGLEMLGRDLEVCHGTSLELHERARELENEGFFPEDAVDKAMSEMVQTLDAPPGFSVARVRTGDATWALVLTGPLPAEVAQRHAQRLESRRKPR